MNLGIAMDIAGGIILGIFLILLAVIICFAGVMVRKKKKVYKKGSFINKPTLILGVIGIAVTMFSVISMAVTSAYEDVGTIFSTIRSKDAVIYNDKYYVKTRFVFNGNSGKYKYKDLDSTALSGAGKLYTLKNYDSYDILVTQDTNITGSVFVAQEEKKDFEREYTDYSKYDMGIVYDKHNAETETLKKEISPTFYKKLVDESNYKRVDEEEISYADEIDSTRNYIFWATSKDKLISSQVKLYPKDKKGLYILNRGESYYELDKNVGNQVDKIVKDFSHK